MQSKAKTVRAYLNALPPDRRASVEAVRNVVLANLDPRIEEGMQYGMIGWYIPHRIFPGGYHADPRQPLPYACLASQKNGLSLYLMNIYADGTDDALWFRREWAKSGKKLDMGKSCIRFKRAEDLALDVIAQTFKRTSVERHLASYAAWDPRNHRAAKKSTARKAPAKKKAAAQKAPARKK